MIDSVGTGRGVGGAGPTVASGALAMTAIFPSGRRCMFCSPVINKVSYSGGQDCWCGDAAVGLCAWRGDPNEHTTYLA